MNIVKEEMIEIGKTLPKVLRGGFVALVFVVSLLTTIALLGARLLGYATIEWKYILIAALIFSISTLLVWKSKSARESLMSGYFLWG
jgi:hypothetical protein